MYHFNGHELGFLNRSRAKISDSTQEPPTPYDSATLIKTMPQVLLLELASLSGEKLCLQKLMIQRPASFFLKQTPDASYFCLYLQTSFLTTSLFSTIEDEIVCATFKNNGWIFASHSILPNTNEFSHHSMFSLIFSHNQFRCHGGLW